MIEASTILLNLEPQQRPTTLFIGLREEVVPVGMCHAVICLPEYEHPRSFFTLSLGDAQDSYAPQGMRTLTASYWLHGSVLVATQALIGLIGRIVPFLTDYLIFVEEYRTDDKAVVMPEGLSLKPLRSADKAPLLFRSSKKNIYRLNNIVETPLQAISASQQFMKKIS
jgi:hypothetical protein